MTCRVVDYPASGGDIGGQFDSTFNPVLVGSIAGTASGNIVADTNGRMLYNSTTTGLSCFDVSSPISPTLVASTTDQPFTVSVKGKYLYGIFPFANQIVVYDITEPGFITRAGVINSTGFTYSFTLFGEYAIVTTLVAGMIIYDVSDLNNIVQISTLTGLSGIPSATVVLGNNVIFRTTAGLCYSVDISNPFAPFVADSITVGGTIAPIKLDRSERYIFMPGDELAGELAVVDVADPANLSVNIITLPSAPYATIVSGGRLLIFPGEDSSIYFYDIIDVNNPVEIFRIVANSLYCTLMGDYVVSVPNAGASTVLDIYQISGLEFVSMSIGSAEFGIVSVRNALKAAQDFSVTGPSFFGGPALFQGDIAVSGRLDIRGGLQEDTRTITAAFDTTNDADIIIMYNNSAAANLYLAPAHTDITRFQTGHKITVIKQSNNEFPIGIDAGGGSHNFTAFVTAAKTFTVTIPGPKSFAAAAVTVATDNINIPAHGFRTGDRVLTTTTGTLPGGISASAVFIIVIDANNVKVASNQANSYAGTPINITSQGTGTHTFTCNGTDKADSVAHGYSGNEIGLASSTTTLPSGLTTTTNYYINVLDANTIRFVTTLSGTAYTYMTNSGTGTHTFTPNQLFGLIAANQEYTLGQIVQVATTGTLPTGLTAATNYYVIPITNYLTGTLNLATSLANAKAGTAIAITGVGSGTHTVQARDRINVTYPSLTPTAGVGAVNLTEPYSSVTLRRSGNGTWITE